MRAAFAVLSVTAVVGSAFADLGSVISSFQVTPPTGLYGNSVYRDPNYVYGLLFRGYNPPYYYLRRYTANGSMVNQIDIWEQLVFCDADGSHLGASYFAVAGDEMYALFMVNKNNGSFGRSLYVQGPGGIRPTAVAWDGRHYYVAGTACRGEFRRYTSTGSLAGTWVAAGWPAAMTSTAAVAYGRRARGKSGDYIIAVAVGGAGCLLDVHGGSCLGTWQLPGGICKSAVYGDSSKPASFGAALWLLRSEYPNGYWVYEVDVGARGGQPVLPNSLGKVKAIYR